MKRIAGIFSVSVIAIATVFSAHANVVSNEFLDLRLASKQGALTAAQMNAANSGITSAKVATYDGYAALIAAKVSANNPTVTINQGGVEKGTFTLNQAGNATINLTDSDTKYTAGTNVQISADNVISATDTKYTASGSNGVSASVSGTVVNVAGTAASKTAAGVVKIGDNITVAEDGTISTHAPVTPGNGTVTITQAGTTKGTFTLNQSGNATIDLTDADTKYTLPVAGTALGGVKSGGNITVATDGAVTVNQATNATTATNAKKICNGASCASYVDIWVE